MKKVLIFIVSLFSIGLFNHCFGYDVIIYGPNNELITMYPIEEGTLEITLNGNWSKNGNNYAFEDGYTGTIVSYIDGYGIEKTVNITSDLYINGNNTISYTGTQYLSLTDSDCGVFNGYNPVFDVTGSIDTLNNENVFNNFSDNALKVLLSNIPSYIQYVTIFFILLFLFGFIRRFKRKR